MGTAKHQFHMCIRIQYWYSTYMYYRYYVYSIPVLEFPITMHVPWVIIYIDTAHQWIPSRPRPSYLTALPLQLG